MRAATRSLGARLRADALGAAPATAGSLDGTEFEWIADADSRLGPVLEVVINGRYGWAPFSELTQVTIEAPADLRDMVWAPAQLTLLNGGADRGPGAGALSRHGERRPTPRCSSRARPSGSRSAPISSVASASAC